MQQFSQPLYLKKLSRHLINTNLLGNAEMVSILAYEFS